MAQNELKLTMGGAAGPGGEQQEFDYSQRAQWLRAAVLGANDGLVSTASMMMGVSAVRTDVRSMVLTGIAGMVAGACSMAIGEFVSVYSQVDVEVAQRRRDSGSREAAAVAKEEGDLPSPVQAAMASATAFSGGTGAAAGGRIHHELPVRLGVAAAAVTVALSAARVLIGGWLAMAVTYALMRLVGGTTGF
ncbi:unnamed protein product [Spirodela intermedia]|uniref:Vacuolar iron transporter n=1 Tax=Spirodela intermedia TaxID=51605 RepID=A0ABN7EDP9_SPIIN|nr:unnamed protein product [Spirodela intermedia]